MPEYLSPAVYMEEISSGIKPIEGVGTSTGAFVGFAQRGPVNKPQLITNPSQFQRVFGGFKPNFGLAYGVQHFFQEGGTRCYIVRSYVESGDGQGGEAPAGTASTTLTKGDAPILRVTALSPGQWGNQVQVAVREASLHPDDPDEGQPRDTFQLVVKYRSKPGDEPEIVEIFDRVSMREFQSDGTPHPLHAEAVINGVSAFVGVQDQTRDPENIDIPDLPQPPDPPDPDATGVPESPFDLEGGDDGKKIGELEPKDLIGRIADGTGLYALDAIDDINIVAIPDLAFNFGDKARDQQLEVLTYCQNRHDCFFVMDPVRGLSPIEVKQYKQGTGTRFRGNAFNSTFGALYYPWIYVTDPLTGKRKMFPPSGAMAGTYSATDVRRGVHKAPAGTEDGFLNVAVDIERIVSKGEQDTLNPEGVNVIRKFPDAGIVAWGTRTVSADPEWKYLNVRRLFLFLEESIEEGTQWVVFEPNDPVLWKRIVRNVSNFLRIQWSEGKLVGATPEEAFFVKCDEETNPPESVDLGRVITMIGVAPSKPAEFVIFRIFQSRAGSGVEE